LARPNRQPTSASLSLLRSSLTQAPAPPLHASLLHAGTALPHLPAPRTQMQRRRISLLHSSAAPPHLLPHGSRRYSAALPPSRCSWLRALSLPSALSLPLAAAPSDPHLDQPQPPPQMTQAAPNLVGMNDEVAAWPFLFVFLCFASSLHGYLATLARRRGRLTPCERLVA